MRRLGMEFDHEAEVVDDAIVFQAVVYAITRERWLESEIRPEREVGH